MNLPWTVGWLIVSVLLAALGIWQDRRPVSLTSLPLLPSIFLLAIGVIGIVLGLGHLLSLLTGVELHGRGSL